MFMAARAQTLNQDLPVDPELWPAISIRCFDCRAFGRDTLVGVHIVRRPAQFLCHDPAPTHNHRSKSTSHLEGAPSCMFGVSPMRNGDAGKKSTIVTGDGNMDNNMMQMFKFSAAAAGMTPTNKAIKLSQQHNDEEGLDWWTKYFASFEAEKAHSTGLSILPKSKNGGGRFVPKRLQNVYAMKNAAGRPKTKRKNSKQEKEQIKKRTPTQPKVAKLTVYEVPLEDNFSNFQDFLKTFYLYRGKVDGKSEEERRVGCFKGGIKLCKYPLSTNYEDGLFTTLATNEPTHVLVRVYIVKATELHPMDLNGKADPYLYLTLGKTKINDKENYISKQLNPVFGRCFEIEALFPHESLLTVQVYDWDLVGRDDLVGETKIDLENRFYSKHRATCGLAETFTPDGYNMWRDWLKPTQILGQLCKENKLDPPMYLPGQVRVGGKAFVPDDTYDYVTDNNECLALSVLRQWHTMPSICACRLVPEHVETRPLYHPDKPGVSQGRLQMWIDMFAMNVAGSSKPPVDIAPRKPTSYELRVIIWNTDEVVLEDDCVMTGEKMSDIYVKGTLLGPEDTQSTDIHYRSMTGEGNFNWRFVFKFNFLEAEEMIVVFRKESFLSWDETEIKIPPRLDLQVWDADNFSADDFLGSLTLDLTAMPRGAKTSKLCTLDMLMLADSEDDQADEMPKFNLFKQKRVKGWWPFANKNELGQYELTGKVEAEFHLMTTEEAEANPGGLGRNGPNALEPPKRPDNSFVWFVNPLMSARHILWHNHKWQIVKLILLLLLFLFVLTFLYSLPGYLVKMALDV